MPRRRGHPVFAAVYDGLLACAERRFLAAHRAHLVGQLRGRVLEVGCGTGLNFGHYPPETAIVGAEPDPHMLRRARGRAARLGRRAQLLEAGAERLPFADAAFDAVVATLVLCTVSDPARALVEIRRVLRPGGELRFLEHVRAASPRWARFQDIMTPLWQRLGAGCHPNRDTVRMVERAGFRVAELERSAAGPYPTRPFVRGLAVRP
ncbi:MAG: methyltransferase domain-containing protein [Candidatus Rokubacteria bacterium]|nr:methyltransferase domain-containing protein [Candidatus Rokubacteria bacterium]